MQSGLGGNWKSDDYMDSTNLPCSVNFIVGAE